MAQIEILSPVSLGSAEVRPLAPRLDSLRGKRIGIRRDDTWRSFEIFAEELGRLFRERLDVAEVVMFDPQLRIGTPEDESARVEEFARSVDAAVVGLGT
ncbi:MAG: hypothetical protein FJ144_08705 [Deltaproteobacteria bacterium]|nr:hypothetical protein [Deltaproteobacteria bacterium]